MKIIQEKTTQSGGNVFEISDIFGWLVQEKEPLNQSDQDFEESSEFTYEDHFQQNRYKSMPNKNIPIERIHEKKLTVYIKSLKIFLKKVA